MALDDLHRVERRLLILLGLDLLDDVRDVRLVLFPRSGQQACSPQWPELNIPSLHPQPGPRNRSSGRIGREECREGRLEEKGINSPAPEWSTAPWAGSSAGERAAPRGGCGTRGRTPPWPRGASARAGRPASPRCRGSRRT